MHSGRWYAAALGDPASRSMCPDAPLVNPWGWRGWPWDLLARIAITAARLHADLLPVDAQVLRSLERLERWFAEGRPAPFTDELSFESAEPRHVRDAIWAAARAAGPLYQARGEHDLDVPDAAASAVAHATAAREALRAKPYARKAALERMASAARERATAWQRTDPARAAKHAQRAAALTARADAIAAEPPDRARAIAETFDLVRPRIVPWLLEQASFAPPPIVVGTVRIGGRLVEYGPDGRIRAIT